jgi:uncharacterized protein (TIGR02246 family)
VYIAFAVADETAAVKEVIQEVFAAERTGNADTLSKYFLPDVTGFFLNGSLRTKGLFIQWTKNVYAAGYRPNLQVNDLDVMIYENTAVATGYLDGAITFPGREVQQVTLEGPWRLSLVLTKQKGKWLIAHYHYSVMIPTPRQPIAVHFPEAAVNGLYQPTGQGPFPAVVLLHGCSGVEEQQDIWAKLLQSWGYVALIVDSFGPRGVEETCTDFGFSVTSGQRALDAYAALRYLQSQPGVDPHRIGVMGWSHGGGPILGIVQERGLQTGLSLPNGGFKAAVAWYPYCYPVSSVTIPLLILNGEDDTMTPAAPCVEMAKSVHRQEAPIVVKLYPGATHAFDVPSFRGPGSEGRPVTFQGHTMIYNVQATEAAKADLKRFLDQYLKGVASAE